MPESQDPERRVLLERARERWRRVIDKYDGLGEDEQGDVLDLETGEIVEDTGHLRSLDDSMEQQDNVWKSLFLAEVADEQQRETQEMQETVFVRRNGSHGSGSGNDNGVPVMTESDEEYYDELLREHPDFFKASRRGRGRVMRSHQPDNLDVGQAQPEVSTPPRKASVQARRDVLSDDCGDDPLALTRSEGSPLTPGKVQLLRKAIELSDPAVNERLKRLVWNQHQSPRRQSFPKRSPKAARSPLKSPSKSPTKPSRSIATHQRPIRRARRSLQATSPESSPDPHDPHDLPPRSARRTQASPVKTTPTAGSFDPLLKDLFNTPSKTHTKILINVDDDDDDDDDDF